jgi:hypothetical protein
LSLARQIGAAEATARRGRDESRYDLGCGEDAVLVSLEEIEPGEWTEKVYTPDIINGPGKLYKRPDYKPF